MTRAGSGYELEKLKSDRSTLFFASKRHAAVIAPPVPPEGGGPGPGPLLLSSPGSSGFGGKSSGWRSRQYSLRARLAPLVPRRRRRERWRPHLFCYSGACNFIQTWVTTLPNKSKKACPLQQVTSGTLLMSWLLSSSTRIFQGTTSSRRFHRRG